MLRPRSVVVLAVAGIALLASSQVTADVVHLSSGQKLTNVQVLSKNWRGYEIQLSQDVKIFFERDEVTSVEYDRIEPGRAARRRAATQQKGTGGPFRGQEVSPELGQQLQQSVNVRFENQDIRKIVASMSEAYGIKVEFDPAVFGPGGLKDSTWTVDMNDVPFIKVIEKLVNDKGLHADLDGEIIRLKLAAETSIPVQSPNAQPMPSAPAASPPPAATASSGAPAPVPTP